MKSHNTGTFQQEGIKMMETSYGIAFLITKKKPHSIGEILVKPRILHGAETAHGESSEDTLKKISSLQSHSKVPNLCFDSRHRTSRSEKDQIITIFCH
jgi:hypothetical protein